MLGRARLERWIPKNRDDASKGDHMAKNPYYSLLGDCYTIVVSACIRDRLVLISGFHGKYG